MLHVTNGDAVAQLIRDAGIEGDVLPWRDVLHEGPVPEGLPLSALSKERAGYVASQGWATRDDAEQEFKERDERFTACSKEDETILWFEHDMYDQLQLIQILALFEREVPLPQNLKLICIDHFPGVERFTGLGVLTPDQLSSLYPSRQPVTTGALNAAATAWRLFRQPQHSELREFSDTPCDALPFLPAALKRVLEEHPSPRDGLSRTERQILATLKCGTATAMVLFRTLQDLEAAPYLGDTVFFSILRRLAQAREPAVSQLPGLHIGLSRFGRDLLDGKANWIVKNGINRWLGGVRFFSN